MTPIRELFATLGGEFASSHEEITQKLFKIRVVLFDWDGVFNSGIKIGDQGSPFSEVDAMGTNMLRYGFKRLNKAVPISAIMTGANNSTAQKFGQREHFNEVIIKAINKRIAFDEFCARYNLKPEEVLFFFDDVLDFYVASKCGVRIMIKRKANILLNTYVKQNNLCDYFTANSGDRFGLREGCELVLGLLGVYDDVIKNRSDFSTDYQNYLDEVRSIDTTIVDRASS